MSNPHALRIAFDRARKIAAIRGGQQDSRATGRTITFRFASGIEAAHIQHEYFVAGIKVTRLDAKRLTVEV